ncbi:MAG: hypothetical protein JO247_20295 [Chloroflexi bacterium]|nr:hypothetical protein [Chloroflexota bacterium]
MSTVTEQPSFPGRWRSRLQARDDDDGGRGRLYRAETIVLIVLAVVLTVATVYDVVRQVHVNARFHADLVSWEAITGRHDRHAIIEQDAKTYTSREVVCGKTASTPSAPAVVCLIFRGPVKAGRRDAFGGYYVLKSGRHKNQVEDVASKRYACFGDAIAQGFRCRATAPPGAPNKPL